MHDRLPTACRFSSQSALDAVVARVYRTAFTGRHRQAAASRSCRSKAARETSDESPPRRVRRAPEDDRRQAPNWRITAEQPVRRKRRRSTRSCPRPYSRTVGGVPGRLLHRRRRWPIPRSSAAACSAAGSPGRSRPATPQRQAHDVALLLRSGNGMTSRGWPRCIRRRRKRRSGRHRSPDLAQQRSKLFLNSGGTSSECRGQVVHADARPCSSCRTRGRCLSAGLRQALKDARKDTWFLHHGGLRLRLRPCRQGRDRWSSSVTWNGSAKCWAPPSHPHAATCRHVLLSSARSGTASRSWRRKSPGARANAGTDFVNSIEAGARVRHGSATRRESSASAGALVRPGGARARTTRRACSSRRPSSPR